MTGAAILRDEAVRKHFHAIIFLPLGQTPVISKLQSLCYMCCTGRELSSELSLEERKEALRQALLGKRVLIALDDLWEQSHESALNFADISAGARVLISTRVKALLSDSHAVELVLPSKSEAARILVSYAGKDYNEQEDAYPTGVPEIVDLCGRLPLALCIAGRLAASVDLVESDDWSGMTGLLKEELSKNISDSTTNEAGMIRASLRGLKGTAEEKANVSSLLMLFSLVPEDTHAPLEVLLLMFKAVYDNLTVTIFHIRKWLRTYSSRQVSW